MRSSVRAAFRAFNAPHEGVVPWLYLDIRGLVTTAIGLLVDDETGAPPARVLAMPFVRPDGERATPAEIAAEWRRVKSLQSMSRQGGGAFHRVTSLRLSREAIDRLTEQKRDDVARELARAFPAFEDWPGDGQMASMSMVYAMGIGRLLTLFPKCVAALRRLDFRTAAAECEMTNEDDPTTPEDESNPGVRERNKANRQMFANAARVLEQRLDPEPIYYPRDLTKVDREAETLRELPGVPSSAPPAAPVLEDDGGASRRAATSEAIVDALRDEITRRER